VHVVDGDTLDPLVPNERLRVRLAEIDAPEKGPQGNASRQSLIAMCGGQPEVVSATGKDRNGRTLARVSCAGFDANAEQVRRGMAWVFDRYSRPDLPLYPIAPEVSRPDSEREAYGGVTLKR
jgi:endonuclease YncB( thermonuclease family)